MLYSNFIHLNLNNVTLNVNINLFYPEYIFLENLIFPNIFQINTIPNHNGFILITIIKYRKSVDLCKQIEAAGVSFITVHGRTTFQKNEPIDQECIKLINESVSIPVILNGDIKSLSNAITMQEYTGCKGS